MKFSFGSNWRSFAARALDDEAIAASRQDFHRLLEGVELSGKRFLDIGFGQGLGVMLAKEAGAEVLGIDIDPICKEAFLITQKQFSDVEPPEVQLVSILDDEFVHSEQEKGGFDVVHSWGVLHHTGDMMKAFGNAASLVKPGGHFVIAIYNRHWTSPIWTWIKILFNHVPKLIQELMVFGFYPICLVGGLILGRVRGMDILHDVRDWLGGYPYEYASKEEVESFFEPLGFSLQRFVPSRGWTGCNEFVFQKSD